MDVSNQNVRPQNTNQAPAPKRQSQMNKVWNNKWMKSAKVVLFVSIVVLVVGLLISLILDNNSQSKYVNSSRQQAVFLNTGQVYFGDIQSINKDYLVLDNIFYLQTNSGANSNTSVNLIKLGCEIHAPLDTMVINQNEVTFWENLSPNGQVAKAISTYWKNNPNGQKCSDQSSAGTSGQSSPQSSNTKQ